MLRLLWRGERAAADAGVVAVARQQADRAHDTERELRQHQQRRAGWLEANAHLGPAYRQVMRELAWQRRVRGLAVEHDQPGYLRDELGPVPEFTRGRRAWRQAAAAIEDYRHSYHLIDPDHALGPVPREPAQRATWQQAQQAVQRVRGRQRTIDRNSQLQRTETTVPGSIDRPPHNLPPTRPRRARSGPERAAG
jgi:hypothetical protein